MYRRTFLVLISAASALTLGFLAANLGSAAPGATAQATPAAPAVPALLSSPNAADVVDAANAFLATLSEEQARSPRSNSSRNSRSAGQTFLVGPRCATAFSTATSSLSRSRRL